MSSRQSPSMQSRDHIDSERAEGAAAWEFPTSAGSVRCSLPVAARTADPFRQFGLSHFCETWRLRLQELKNRDFAIVFDGQVNRVKHMRVLRIDSANSTNRVVGHVRFDSTEWPVFAWPEKRGVSDRTLLTVHRQQTVAPLATEEPDGIHVHVDLFRDIGRCLRGALDLTQASHSDSNRLGLVPPIIDGYERMLIHLLCRLTDSKQPRRPVDWPDGSDFAVVLTHDVDRIQKTFQYFTHSWRSLRRGDLRGVHFQMGSFRERLRGREPYWTFDQVAALEESLGVKSTFFFLNETGKPSPDPATWKLYYGRYRVEMPKLTSLIRRLVKDGWEVALHGSYGSADNIRLLFHEKAVLERVAGSTVHGVRQHYFRLIDDVTWPAQEQAGFRYDASIGWARYPGFARGTCLPFRPWPVSRTAPIGLIEIPTTLMDTAVMYESMKSLRPRVDARNIAMALIDQVRSCGGVLNLLWHSQSFAGEDYPGASELYEDLVRTCRHQHAWFATARDLANWWQATVVGGGGPAATRSTVD